MRIVCILIVTLFLFPAGAFADSDPFGYEAAATHYEIKLELLKAISSVESNHNNGAINNGTYDGNPDQGHMQVHSGTWRKSLGEARWKRMLEDPKYCTMMGAYILRLYINEYGNNQHAVSAYHTNYSLDELREKAATGIEEDVKRYERGKAYVARVKVAYKKYCGKKTPKLANTPKKQMVANNDYHGEDDQPLRSHY